MMYLAHGNLDKGKITVDKLTEFKSKKVAEKFGINKRGEIKAVVYGADFLELYGLDKDELLKSFEKWRGN